MEVLELRDWTQAPIDQAIKNGLRELLGLIGRKLTWEELDSLLWQVADIDRDRSDRRYAVLEKVCDGIVTSDGGRWTA